MLTSVVDRLFSLPPVAVYVVVAALVFVEDALFVGFVFPAETAAILGGVIASQGDVNVYLLGVIVVLCAIGGDSVGYEIGKHFGPRLLAMKILSKHQKRLGDAQEFLANRGGIAVFLGRFVAFFRAVMPALAGIARMPYGRFLPWNAIGGVVWGVGVVLLGYLAGNSYKRFEHAFGQIAVYVVCGLLVLFVAWEVYRRVRERRAEHPVEEGGADGGASTDAEANEQEAATESVEDEPVGQEPVEKSAAPDGATALGEVEDSPTAGQHSDG